MTVEAKTLFVAMLVGLAHIISGIAVLTDPAALDVTPLASLAHFARAIGHGHTGGFVGAVLLGAGVMAVLASNLDLAFPRYIHSLMFLPQQVLLLLQVWTISVALIVGHYPDGYVPAGGAWFILTDQIWGWVLAVTHSVWLAAFIYGGRASRGNIDVP